MKQVIVESPEEETPHGAAAESSQRARQAARRNAASEAHYENGFAVERRARMTPAKAARAAKASQNGGAPENGAPAPRFEGPVGATWYMNPAWWIAGALVFMTWQRR
jgi:hypothetical protein